MRDGFVRIEKQVDDRIKQGIKQIHKQVQLQIKQVN